MKFKKYIDNIHKIDKPHYNLRKIIILFVILLFVSLAASAIYFFFQYEALKNQYQSSALASQKQIKKIVAEVSKLMLLPKNELPTIATVSDEKKLSSQPFFAHARNGDEVLVFANAKIAILYDPVEHLIINVSPVTIGGQTSQASQARIVLRNGTIVQGITSKIESQIQQVFPGANIVSRDYGHITYDTTMVIPLSSQANAAAQDLAKALNANVGTLPAGEVKPSNADILIIVGKDKS